jgi:hypothetical protein
LFYKVTHCLNVMRHWALYAPPHRPILALTCDFGTGFVSGEQVELLINDIRLAWGRADAGGQYTDTVKIPARIPFGDVTVKAKGKGTNEGSYTAALNPGLSPSTDQGGVGTPLIVYGHAFSVTEVYTVTFVDAYNVGEPDCIDAGATVSETLGTGTTTSVGSFKLDTTVPDVVSGTYYVVAVGENSATCAVK